VRCARGLVGRGRTLAESGRAQASSGGRHAASAHLQAPSFRTQALVRSSPQVVKTSASVVRSSARVMRRGPKRRAIAPTRRGLVSIREALDGTRRASLAQAPDFIRTRKQNEKRRGGRSPKTRSRDPYVMRVVIDGDGRRSRAPSRSDRERASLSPRRPLDGSRVERGRRCFTAAAPSNALRRSPLR
jgi:hypothetical protein